MLELAGKKVFSIAERALLVCTEKALTVEVIRTMAEQRPEPVICLDAGFAGSDQLIAELPDPRRRVHVLFAVDVDDDNVRVVTAYRPDPEEWEPGFARRKH